MLHFNEFADFSSLSQKLATQWLELVNVTPANSPSVSRRDFFSIDI